MNERTSERVKRTTTRGTRWNMHFGQEIRIGGWVYLCTIVAIQYRNFVGDSVMPLMKTVHECLRVSLHIEEKAPLALLTPPQTSGITEIQKHTQNRGSAKVTVFDCIPAQSYGVRANLC